MTQTIEYKGYEVAYEEVDTLYGHTIFRSFDGKENDFESEYDDDIYYADGSIESIINELIDDEEEGINSWSYVDIYLFDGWFIGLKSYW